MVDGPDAAYGPPVTPREAGRRVPVGALYVALCTGLAVLVTQGTAPVLSMVALIVLMLPVSIVGFAVVVNVLFLVVDSGSESQGWMVGFVVCVAAMAWLQVRIVRNTRAAPAEMHLERATSARDTGL